ncbi:hypothetical protein [Arthrobacter castelli]|uniref:hypothetical protein n=1 Tax=Arthrobacter castelli TaxID=271431 RepID=UPI000421B7E8|nr:hypothetical protein [Arthrobacter castelli]
MAGSGIAAGIYLVVLAGAWVWTEAVGFSRPDTLTGFLIWIYALLGAVVIAALFARFSRADSFCCGQTAAK